MFEIIMLFAFLAAATSQLLPVDSSRSKLKSRIKKCPVRKGFAPGKPFQKLMRNGRKNEERNTIYACVA